MGKYPHRKRFVVIGDGSSFGIGGMGVELQELSAQSLFDGIPLCFEDQNTSN